MSKTAKWKTSLFWKGVVQNRNSSKADVHGIGEKEIEHSQAPRSDRAVVVKRRQSRT